MVHRQVYAVENSRTWHVLMPKVAGLSFLWESSTMRALMTTSARTRWTIVLLLLVAFPAFVLAKENATGTILNAVAPVGMVSAGAGELASFVLSAVALVVAGIALSRTR